MKRKAAIFRGVAGVMAFLMLITVTASTLTFQYAGVINEHLNVPTTKVIQVQDGEEANTDYYTSEYGTDYYNKSQANLLELAASSENIHQVEEGTVLLRNENGALPLAEGERITIFGNASDSGCVSSTISTIPSVTFSSAMENALGAENVNSELVENIYSNLSKTTNTEVVEAPLSDLLPYEGGWQQDYNDAAVMVIERVGGEDQGTAFYHADGSRFLGLSANERDTLAYLQEQKEQEIFGKIIVVINAVQMMELDWLDDYGVDACLLVSEMGATGYEGLANVMTGLVNPSGRTVDTLAANSLSAPAVTYGENAVGKWSNMDEVHERAVDYQVENPNWVENYLIYAEGIYVGYKYYETRYEDTVLKAGNAGSPVGSSTGAAWNYSDEVCYTFGYGLSYTTFDQELNGVEYDGALQKYIVDVTVTNTGDVPGKSVVEVYAQTPYGDYEKQNQVEKSAIQIVNFEKTRELAPGESETLQVEVDPYMLASYDSKGAAGYILSAGDYYLAIGEDAHDALNNILAKKGYTVADGMTAEGDANKVYQWNQDTLDTEAFRMSRVNSEVEVTNLFDHADINYYSVEFDYLSRADWEGTFPEEAVQLEVNDQMFEDMNMNWYKTPADAPSVESFTQGADNGLSFIDMRLVEWDDEETWNSFIDQFTVAEMASLLNDTQGVAGIDRLGIPAQVRSNDCFTAGTLLATGEQAISWTSEVTTARTWNKERFTERGRIMGIESAFCGKNENWYGGGNLHRTPFSGRNRQYYSEDGNFGYIVGAYEAKAMQEQGVIYCIKHFALNETEEARQGVATFVNEQALREIYLRAFEGAFCEGGAMGTMTAFNRIGLTAAEADKSLLTDLLRGEWGFKGRITPDGFSDFNYRYHYAEKFEAGIDYHCLDTGHASSAIQEYIAAGDGHMLQLLRDMTKRNLYPILRSTSVNGLDSGTIVMTVVPAWQTAILAANILTAVGFVVCVVGMILTGFAGRGKKHEDQ